MNIRIIGNEEGAFSMLFSVAVFLLVVVLALSTDIGKTQSGFSKVQSATDSAVLSTAEFIQKGKFAKSDSLDGADWVRWKPTEDEITAYAEQVFLSNFSLDQSGFSLTDPDGNPAKFDVVYDDKEYRVDIEACAYVKPTKLAASLGKDRTQKVCVESSAGFNLGYLSDTEIAYALDVTASMYVRTASGGKLDKDEIDKGGVWGNGPNARFRNTRIKRLHEAFIVTLDKYMGNAEEDRIYMSVVPFSAMVNLFPYSKDHLNDPANFDHPKKNDGKWNIKFGKAGEQYPEVDFHDEANYALKRIPTIENLQGLDGSYKKFPTYKKFLNKHRSWRNGNAEKAHLYERCYAGTILYALDERIERMDGKSLITKNEAVPNSGQRRIMSESFPIQPLTYNKNTLKRIVDRFIEQTSLKRNHTVNTPRRNEQNSRRRKMAGGIKGHGTSTIHGLLWAWYTVAPQWSGKWNRESVHENYFYSFEGAANHKKADRASLSLPNSDPNAVKKHIVLIADGGDTDGVTDSTSARCDAFMRQDSLRDNEFVKICRSIKASGVDISIVQYNSDAPSDKFQRCASEGRYYQNVNPNQIGAVMDNIISRIAREYSFTKILK